MPLCLSRCALNVWHVKKVTQWAGGIAAGVVLALAVGWALFIPAADWIAAHDVGHVTGATRVQRLQTARDAAQGRLLTFGAGLVATGALAFTARSFVLSRRTYDLTEQGQVTERYSRGIELLGSEKVDVRLGAIYALGRVAWDSARDHATVMDVLAAFIREHSREQVPDPAVYRQHVMKVRADVEAALVVIGRRDRAHDSRLINLAGMDFTGADLTGAVLADTDFTAAVFTDADLTRADLTGAKLTGVKFIRANLAEADLSGARLNYAELGGARLIGAKLTGADLALGRLVGAHFDGADLTDAKLSQAALAGANLARTNLTGARLNKASVSNARLNGANLTRASLSGARLDGAHLRDANFTNAALNMADLTGADIAGATFAGANLTSARWPENTDVPEGWQRDARGRLQQDDAQIEQIRAGLQERPGPPVAQWDGVMPPDPVPSGG
jgi:uncharacterized protein YjbI with pentapeptide repeats